MKGILINTAFLVTGAAIGSLVTWKVMDKKCEQRIKEDVESVKKIYANTAYGDAFTSGLKKGVENTNADIKEKIEEEAAQILNECNDILEQANYVAYSNPEKGGSDTTVCDKPYVIAPEDCGDLAGYDVISLTYFADGVLTDDDYNLIDNVNEIVGSDFHEHFGEYEDDSVFIRNDAKECDYEILADTRKYTDVVTTHLGYDE